MLISGWVRWHKGILAWRLCCIPSISIIDLVMQVTGAHFQLSPTWSRLQVKVSFFQWMYYRIKQSLANLVQNIFTVTDWLTRQDNAWSDLGPKIFWLPPTLFQASPGFRRPGFKLLVHLEHLNNICKAHHRAQGRGQGSQPGQAAGGDRCLLYNVQ